SRGLGDVYKRQANEYQILYGPLQNFGRAYSKYPWEWNQTPWPWQV
ncbi:spore coat protein CotJB, partial [Bacillus cereus]|nr:spore coat protein CotJB [Bacillus cereus]